MIGEGEICILNLICYSFRTSLKVIIEILNYNSKDTNSSSKVYETRNTCLIQY